MNFLRSMDLYKAIVLLSLVLLPLGGWWVMRLENKIDASKKAIDEARRPGGLIEEIGSLQRKVEVVVQNKRSTSDSINDPRTYFEGQILAGRWFRAEDQRLPAGTAARGEGDAGVEAADHRLRGRHLVAAQGPRGADGLRLRGDLQLRVRRAHGR